MNRTHQFFQRASDDYHHLIRTGNAFQFVRPIVEPRMGEKVLDVGNGGLKEFFPSCTSLYVGLDFSLEMLKRGPEKEFNLFAEVPLPFPSKIRPLIPSSTVACYTICWGDAGKILAEQ